MAVWLDIDDAKTWRTENDRVIVRLWRLQGGVCALCGKPMEKRANKAGNSRLSVDHVWPRNRDMIRGRPAPPGCGRNRRKSKWWGRRGAPWNQLAAHSRCNSAKSNRPPTGCELIWLAAVRARLGEVI